MERQLKHEIDLGSFNAAVRRKALSELHRLLLSGEVAATPELPVVNLHCHTFFSFNAYYFSPSGLSWEAKKRGLYAAGIIDFDVLDGVEEFLKACSLLGLRSAAGIESRVFIDEWKDREINSPKEPGIYYSMGYGFTGIREGDPRSQQTLRKMANLARRRNEAMLGRLNSYLRELHMNYEKDVLPLTPSGNATERHMLVAIDEKSKKVFPGKKERIRFWADALSVGTDEVQKLIDQPVELQMFIRSRLMKHGGPGYSPPDRENFPSLDDMIAMVKGFGAIPTAGWLDGTSRGEENADEFLDFLIQKGASCLAIIPDRNWNIRDIEERKLKVKKLNEILSSARNRKMPVLAGTEMNKNGQKFVDDFFTNSLRPFHEDFLRGARIMNGHTLLRSVYGFGLLSGDIEERYHGNIEARNNFFEEVGRIVPSTDRSELESTIRKLWGKKSTP